MGNNGQLAFGRWCRLGVRGFVFDSGDTLIYPAKGEWIPVTDMAELISTELGRPINPESVRQHLSRPLKFLEGNHHVTSIEDERALWRRFYSLLLDELAVTSAIPTERFGSLLDTLVSLLHNPTSIRVYPETREVLEALRTWRIPTGILSDSWPSLRKLLSELKLDTFFDTIVISAELGFTKPDPRMYLEVSNRLGIPPSELLFVDNDLANVEGALSVDMVGVLIDRDGSANEYSSRVSGSESRLHVIRCLKELVSA